MCLLAGAVGSSNRYLENSNMMTPILDIIEGMLRRKSLCQEFRVSHSLMWCLACWKVLIGQDMTKVNNYLVMSCVGEH